MVDIGKGGARDARQVLANGGVATVCAVVAGILSLHPTAPYRAPGMWIAAFAGAYAAATADTWGTEIGTLMRGAPRSILTWRPIPTGLSGGVTLWGSIAEVTGAVWITLWTPLVDHLAVTDGPDFIFVEYGNAVPVVMGGIAGALVDSLLGATLQELRECPQCRRTCETDPHHCGASTTLVRGWPGFSNDLVNGAATLTGAAVALLIASAEHRY